jgi:hypothetical protein
MCFGFADPLKGQLRGLDDKKKRTPGEARSTPRQIDRGSWLPVWHSLLSSGLVRCEQDGGSLPPSRDLLRWCPGVNACDPGVGGSLRVASSSA